MPPRSESEWERAYDDAMQWRDWQTCEQMLEERAASDWYVPDQDAGSDVCARASGKSEVGPVGNDGRGSDPAVPSIAEGSPCPTCKRRVPYKKKDSSPLTKVVSIRVPVGDVETFKELLETCAEYVGATQRPHHLYWTIQMAAVALLQSPDFEGALK